MIYRLPGNLVVRSRWRPYRAAAGERVLIVRAGGVFPPGHASTRLCLEMLAESLVQRPGVRVLDVGCGSGILALAAAALGASGVVAVDISRRAVRMTRENALGAPGPGNLTIIQGSTECLKGPFDLVVANLPPAVQMAKAEEFRRLTAPGGLLILSGFKDTQEEPLQSACDAAGWLCTQRRTRDAWAPELPPELSYTWTAWRLERRA
jgi:ribosomal protein L11 methyltransferase